jgi:2-C-methyl-D-erythritol 4-phosphate cytidylyltransferase
LHLLIPAAGMGKRMGSSRNKLFLTLHQQPILAWTLMAAAKATEIEWIGIIAQPYDWEDIQEMLDGLKLSQLVRLIAGGDTRQESVYKGLQALPPEADKVLIHDGARCLATSELLDRCARAFTTWQGFVAAIPVKDTIKVVNADGVIQDTPDRSFLWAAQTPQGFDVQLLKQCHDKGLEMGWEVTDDAALFEKCSFQVGIVEGEETNLKVTTPVDLAIAEYILQQRGQ